MSLIFFRWYKNDRIVYSPIFKLIFDKAINLFFKRVWLLLTSFVGFNVAGAPGVSLGTAAAQQGGSSMWALTGTYAPTWVEIVVVIGVVSLGALAFLVLAQKLLPGRAAPRDAEAAAVERPAGEAA